MVASKTLLTMLVIILLRLRSTEGQKRLHMGAKLVDDDASEVPPSPSGPRTGRAEKKDFLGYPITDEGFPSPPAIAEGESVSSLPTHETDSVRSATATTGARDGSTAGIGTTEITDTAAAYEESPIQQQQQQQQQQLQSEAEAGVDAEAMAAAAKTEADAIAAAAEAAAAEAKALATAAAEAVAAMEAASAAAEAKAAKAATNTATATTTPAATAAARDAAATQTESLEPVEPVEKVLASEGIEGTATGTVDDDAAAPVASPHADDRYATDTHQEKPQAEDAENERVTERREDVEDREDVAAPTRPPASPRSPSPTAMRGVTVDLSAFEAELAARAAKGMHGSSGKGGEIESTGDVGGGAAGETEDEYWDRSGVSSFSLPREVARPVERIIAVYKQDQNFANWYKILSVESEVSREVVREAYQQVGKVVHPQNNPHPQAAQAFAIVQEALDVLDSPPLRSRFDTTLEARSEPLFIMKRYLKSVYNFCVNLKSRTQVLIYRVKEGDVDIEVEEMKTHLRGLKTQAMTAAANFWELPSLKDKVLYLGEVVSDHRYALGTAGVLTTYISVKRAVRSVLERRSAKVSPWKRALSRRVQQRKAIFTTGDETSPSRMLI